MFIDRLLNEGNGPLLEQTLRFTEARHQMLLDNVANVDTPNYEQKDLDVKKFDEMLTKRVAERDESAPGEVGFSDITADVKTPHSTLLFHDRNNRSMEQLMTNGAKNALLHNVIVELLRKQYAVLDMALKERVS
jgi:flagellar basal-body rod protein FlgB